MLRREGHLMRGSAEDDKKDGFELDWKDQIEEALSSIGMINWRSNARSRGAWKALLRHAHIR